MLVSLCTPNWGRPMRKLKHWDYSSLTVCWFKQSPFVPLFKTHSRLSGNKGVLGFQRCIWNAVIPELCSVPASMFRHSVFRKRAYNLVRKLSRNLSPDRAICHEVKNHSVPRAHPASLGITPTHNQWLWHQVVPLRQWLHYRPRLNLLRFVRCGGQSENGLTNPRKDQEVMRVSVPDTETSKRNQTYPFSCSWCYS